MKLKRVKKLEDNIWEVEYIETGYFIDYKRTRKVFIDKFDFPRFLDTGGIPWWKDSIKEIIKLNVNEYIV